jgi:hypothetical protein
MSRVKKYNQGGSYYGEDLERFLDRKTEEAKFTAPGLTSKEQKKQFQKEVREVARQWANLAKDPNFDQLYKYDRIKDVYNIDQNNLPNEFGGRDWTGTEEPVSKNIVGQYVIDPTSSKHLNSIVASWINEYKDRYTKPSKVKKNIPNIVDSFINLEFGTDENLFESKWNTLPTEERKQRIVNRVLQDLNSYKEDASKNPDEEYLNTEKAQEIIQALENNDWDGFIKSANSIGWDIDSLLKEQKAEEVPQKTEEELLLEKIKLFGSVGITDPAIARSLIGSGWEIDSEYDPYGDSQFQTYLRDNKGILLKDPTGNRMVVKGNNHFNQAFLSPTQQQYGRYWKHDDSGFAQFYTPESEEWDADLFSDPLGTKTGWRQLEGKLPTKYRGWNIKGYPSYDTEGKVIKDPLGYTDYTKRLVLNSNGDDPIELVWSEDRYKTLEGDDFGPIDLTKYGSLSGEWSSDITKLQGDPFNKLTPNRVFGNFQEAKEAFENLQRDKDGRVIIGKSNQNKSNLLALKNILEDLRFRMNSAASYIERERAFDLYQSILEDFSDKGDLAKLIIGATANAPIVEKLNSARPPQGSLLFKKKGGVLKAQEGTKLSPEEFVSKYGKKDSGTKSSGGIKDIRGTFSDASALDIASAISTGVSMIPVVGAVGGATTMGLDILRDVKEADGKVNWGTHLGNTAFVGLSLFGLGGLRALKLAAKGAKAADAVLDAGKAAMNAQKMTKAGAISPEVQKSVEGISKTIKKLGTSNLDEYLKKLKTVNTKTLTSTEKSVLENFGMTVRKNGSIQVSNSGKTLSRAEAVKKIEEAKDVTLGLQTINTSQWAPEMAMIQKGWDKTIKSPIGRYAIPVGLGAVPVIKGVQILPRMLEDYRDGGFGNINIDDAKSMMLLTGIGAQSYKNIKTASAVKKFTSPASTTASKHVLKVGDKKLSLEKEIVLPKKSGKPFAKKYDEDDLIKFGNDLKESGVENSDEIIKLLKKGETPKIELVKGTTSGLQLDISPEKVMKNPSEFILAMRAFRKGLRPSGASAKVLGGEKMEILQKKWDLINKQLQTTTAQNQITILKEQQNQLMKELANFKEGGVLKFQNPASTLEKNKQKFIIGNSQSHSGYNPYLPLDDREREDKILNSIYAIPYNRRMYSGNIISGRPDNQTKPPIYKYDRQTDNQTKPPIYKYDRQTDQLKKMETIKAKADVSNPMDTGLTISKKDVAKNNNIITRPDLLEGLPKINGFSLKGDDSGEVATRVGTSGWAGQFDDSKISPILKEWIRYIDPTLIANTAGLLATYRTNNRIAKLQRQSIVNSVVPPNLLSRRHYTLSSDADIPYIAKAAEMRAKAGRLATSTSNFNPLIQLEGQKLASNLELEGAAKKFGDVMQQRAQQEQSDAAVDQTNLGLINKYKASVAEATRNIPLITANKLLSNNANLNRFILDSAYNLKQTGVKLAAEDLQTLKYNPEYKKYSEELMRLENNAQTAKTEWEDYLKTPAGMRLVDKNFENSKFYKDYEASTKSLNEQYEPLLKEIARKKIKVNPAYFKSGGTISDKIVLENVKQAHRKELLHLKTIEKQGSEINKLLISSLIKIFK